jgi:nucleotidyltransferase/DNA polymerase involved in DNA repair
METTATILHADLDAFYASVEQLLDPSLCGKPVAVGGGVVLAASYEAKAFGVRGGMPGRQARELCPQLTFVSGHFQHYRRLGDAAIKVVNDFTPLVERISIDEAFADVAGCIHLFGPPAEIARAIRRRVRSELGLPISVGVARTKHLAKIASQVAKPDGLVVVDPDTELEFLHHLPVELMSGVGPVTRARLAEIGVLTIGQLARREHLSEIFDLIDRIYGYLNALNHALDELEGQSTQPVAKLRRTDIVRCSSQREFLWAENGSTSDSSIAISSIPHHPPLATGYIISSSSSLAWMIYSSESDMMFWGGIIITATGKSAAPIRLCRSIKVA